MDISDIKGTDLQDGIIGPIIIDGYRKQVTKRMRDYKYMDILGFYIMSKNQDFGNFLGTEVGSVEDDIRLVLDENNSSFVTYELKPGIYTFKDISEVLFNILQSEYLNIYLIT